jgi:hypothetical protein
VSEKLHEHGYDLPARIGIALFFLFA